MDGSKVMYFLNGSYATYVNTKRKRSGHLWQGRFKSILVDRDSYLLELSRYLHLNPVRAGTVDHPGEYSHSNTSELPVLAPSISNQDSAESEGAFPFFLSNIRTAGHNIGFNDYGKPFPDILFNIIISGNFSRL